MTNGKRFYDIDWLRVLGMGMIFLFHNARFFNDDDWHVKNFELDFGMSVFVRILDHFIMPLFFVLSAIAIYYALRKRSNARFMGERVNRLLIPLGVGIFTHIILQVYILAVHPALLRWLVRLRRQLRLDGPAPVVPADAVRIFRADAAGIPVDQAIPELHK